MTLTKPRFMFYSMPKNLYLILKFIFIRNKKEVTHHIVDKFESIFGIKDLLLLPQCRVGIYLAVKAVVDNKRSEIIVPAYTIYDVVNMVLAGGGTPVFCDVKRSTSNIDPKEIVKCITPKTRGVLVPHLHGLSAEMTEIRGICDKHGILLMEDVAQSLGGNYAGMSLGAIGDISVFSFGRAKNINSFFGGAISVSDKTIRDAIQNELDGWAPESFFKLWSRIILTSASYILTTPILFNLVTFKYFQRSIRTKGENGLKLLATENNPVRRNKLPDAYKRKLSKLQEYLVLEQLDDVKSNSKKRKAIADIYKSEINFSENLAPQTVDMAGSHEFFQFPIIVDDRYKLGKYLLEQNVDIAFQHLNNLASVECFSQFAADCPEAEFSSKALVLLPTYPGFGISDARKIVKALNNYGS